MSCPATIELAGGCLPSDTTPFIEYLPYEKYIFIGV